MVRLTFSLAAANLDILRVNQDQHQDQQAYKTSTEVLPGGK